MKILHTNVKEYDTDVEEIELYKKYINDEITPLEYSRLSIKNGNFSLLSLSKYFFIDMGLILLNIIPSLLSLFSKKIHK
jgi:hypothetical protein